MTNLEGPFRYVRLANVNSLNYGIPARILEWTEGVFFLEVAECGTIEFLRIGPENYRALRDGMTVCVWAREEEGDTFYDDYKMIKKAEDEDVLAIEMYEMERINEESYRDLLKAWNYRTEMSSEEEAELVELLGGN